MSGSDDEQAPRVLLPETARFDTVLMHGSRFKAHRREGNPYDILTVGGGGVHVATVHGEAGDETDENAACLAASAEMLTALVDLVAAHCLNQELPWSTAKAAILAGFGAPSTGERFTNRWFQNAKGQSAPPGTEWKVARVGYCGSKRVLVGLSSGDPVLELEFTLDELRQSFTPMEA